MRKNLVHSVVIRRPDESGRCALRSEVNRFHVSVIERRLAQLNCTAAQKQYVIRQIQEELRRREVAGVIRIGATTGASPVAPAGITCADTAPSTD